VTRAWIVLAMVLAGSVASAAPDSRPVAAPPPDGTGVRPRPSPADNRRIVGILEVRVEGLSDDVKETFQRGLEDQFDTKHYWLASRTYMRQRLSPSTKWTDGCIVGECLAEVRARTGAELVLLAALTGSGTSFGYVVTLVRTDTGRVLQQDSGRCDVCTLNEVITNAKLATVGLLNNVPDKLPDEAAEQTAAISAAVGKVKGEIAAHDQHTTRVGIVLTAVGAAAAITGGLLYELAGKPSYALPIAAGGGALAAGGVVVLTF
jgi:hypothetical protein